MVIAAPSPELAAAPAAVLAKVRAKLPPVECWRTGRAPVHRLEPSPKVRPFARNRRVSDLKNPLKSTESRGFGPRVTVYGYRYYDPITGRWPSRDPIGDVGGSMWFEYQGLRQDYKRLEIEMGDIGWFISLITPGFYPSEIHGSNLSAFVRNGAVALIDYLGLDVLIHARSLQGMGGGAGVHTWVEVKDKDGNKTTYSGIKDENKKLGVKKDYKPDNKPGAADKGSIKVPPPAGMSQDEWDQAVKDAGEKALEKDGKRDYKPFGGDGGKKSGNCNSTTSDIIEEAGGKVPKGFDPPGANPGLRN